MTSNIGARFLQKGGKLGFSGDTENRQDSKREQVLEELRKHFSPEFLNRIDDVIMFTPLNREDVKNIVELNLQSVAKRLKKTDIELSWTDRALYYIAEVGFDPQYGARPIKRVIQKEILNKLSKDILGNVISSEAKIILDFKNGEVIFTNESLPKIKESAKEN